jgi:hypothetical protein
LRQLTNSACHISILQAADLRLKLGLDVLALVGGARDLILRVSVECQLFVQIVANFAEATHRRLNGCVAVIRQGRPQADDRLENVGGGSLESNMG